MGQGKLISEPPTPIGGLRFRAMPRRFLICGALLLLPMAMLHPLWSCPTSAGEDDVVYYYPLRSMVAEQVGAGQWPAWNDREAAGVGLFADPQSGLFHPANLLFLFLPGKLAYSLSVFLAFAVAGGGAWLYLRRLGLAGPAAAFGSAAFMFSGFMVGHRVHLSVIQAAALLPWGMWSIELTRRSARSAFAAMTLIFALTLAAGHWATAVHMMLAWTAYLLLRGRPVGRAVLAAGAAAVMGTALMAPQIAATAGALSGTIRSAVPYVVAGENSFFPLCGVLAFFPFIMGSRTPNFFAQDWWGPWHLCEMLGYVGLITLPLAFAAMWRLCRKGKTQPADADPAAAQRRSLVRAWTVILIAAAVWALGYYLPTYRLVHMLPVLSVIRCPARMLLVIDLALATLAAVSIHALLTKPPAALRTTVRRATTAYLPLCMIVSLALLAALARLEGKWWSLAPLLSNAGAEGLREAIDFHSPAVWVPILLAAATGLAVWWFLRSPRRRAWTLTGLLLVDLFFITRFVDVPASGDPMPQPHNSPAAAWLRANAPPDEPYRIWGLSRSYHHRPAELLLPKACATLGIQTISYYGPFQPAEHPLLLGFRSWGENYEWAWLIRRNHLLSLFNVRYILAADPERRAVIESVRIPAGPPAQSGPELLAGDWQLTHAELEGNRLRLRRGLFSWGAQATQPVTLAGGRVYRISLDARAPEGAGNYLGAEYVPDSDDPASWWANPGTMRIDYERLGPGWRHFEWTFQAPVSVGDRGSFRVFTASEKAVEVRRVSLRRADWEAPINLGSRLEPGQPVYVDRTPDGLAPLRPGDPPVHIYENRLCLPRSFPVEEVLAFDDVGSVVEALRWRAGQFDLTRQALAVGSGRRAEEARFVSVSPDAPRLRGAQRAGANGMGTVVFGRDGEPSPAAGWPRGTSAQISALVVYLLMLAALAWRSLKNRPSQCDV